LQKRVPSDAGHHDDRNALQSKVLLEITVKLKPVFVGHHHIQDDQGRLFPLGFAQTLAPVPGMDGGVPAASQKIAEEELHVGLIVDDQDLDLSFHVSTRVNCALLCRSLSTERTNCADTEFTQLTQLVMWIRVGDELEDDGRDVASHATGLGRYSIEINETSLMTRF
jgi:hypothetical protein